MGQVAAGQPVLAVENIEDTVKVLESEGTPTIFSFPLDMIEWDKLLGPENTRTDLPHAT